jgi:hypothetical protein
MKLNYKNILFFLFILVTFFLTDKLIVNADTFIPSSKLQYYEGYEENYNSGESHFHEDSYNYGSNIVPPLTPGYAEHPFAISLLLDGSYKAGNTYVFTATLYADLKGSTFKFYYPNLLYMAWFARLGYLNEKTTCNFDMISENSRFDITCTYQPSSNASRAIISFVNFDWQNNGYLTYDDLGTFFKWDNINIQLYSDSSGAIIQQNQTIIDQNQTIINQNQQQIEAQNKTNDILSDDNVDSSNATNTLTNLSNSTASNSVISDLLLLPVRLFQNIVNSINGSCSPFNLGSLYNSTLVLPCINMSNLIGSTLWSVIDILFCGSFILVIRKKFVDIFENLSELKNGGNEVE